MREICKQNITTEINIFTKTHTTWGWTAGLQRFWLAAFYLCWCLIFERRGGCGTDWQPQWKQWVGMVEVEKSRRPFSHDYSGLAAATTHGGFRCNSVTTFTSRPSDTDALRSWCHFAPFNFKSPKVPSEDDSVAASNASVAWRERGGSGPSVDHLSF